MSKGVLFLLLKRGVVLGQSSVTPLERSILFKAFETVILVFLMCFIFIGLPLICWLSPPSQNPEQSRDKTSESVPSVSASDGAGVFI